MGESEPERPGYRPRVLGRYELHDALASGGMATVHVGRLLGPVGFSRTVAIKRLHEQFARDPEFVSMFLDEARLAAKIRHPNVISTLDVVATADELFLVMEYVQGESLGRLLRASSERGEPPPLSIVSAILSQLLQGLHAAHEACDEHGRPLGIVHRDVSPQNVLVGTDGVTRVLDFGVAKANHRVHETRSGEIKGKLSYMAPEQIRGGGAQLTRAVDIYAAGIVMWEALTCQRLFKAETDAETMYMVLTKDPPPVRSVEPSVSASLEAVVMRALSRDPTSRFGTAEDMAVALAAAGPAASQMEVARWVRAVAHESIALRAARVAEIERSSAQMPVPVESGARMRKSVAEIEVTVDPAPPPPSEAKGTQVTTTGIAASFEPKGPPSTRRWLVPAVGAASAALVIGVIVVSRMALRPSVASAGSPPPAASEPSPAPASASSSALSVDSSAVAPPPASAAPPEPVSAPALTLPSAAASTRLPPRAPRAPPLPARPPTPTKPTSDVYNHL